MIGPTTATGLLRSDLANGSLAKGAPRSTSHSKRAQRRKWEDAGQ
jgi:hypothetical protein